MSWAGDLDALACGDRIYIDRNPNQVAAICAACFRLISRRAFRRSAPWRPDPSPFDVDQTGRAGAGIARLPGARIGGNAGGGSARAVAVAAKLIAVEYFAVLKRTLQVASGFAVDAWRLRSFAVLGRREALILAELATFVFLFRALA